MTLRDAWEAGAEDWVRWAREPGHDSYWRFHRALFLELLPEPGKLTVDVGCGEGRVSRDLAGRGHRVIALDASSTMVEHARQADPGGEYLVADAAALPLENGSADLVVAFMSLMDVDDMPGAVAESARVLEPGGRLCLAVVHPINSAGKFESEEPGSAFRIEGSYLEPSPYTERIERDGLTMTFTSMHWPLEAYTRALEDAGLLIEAIREFSPSEAEIEHRRSLRWLRIPLFLAVRAVKPAGSG